jgi:hypothetical protein
VIFAVFCHPLRDARLEKILGRCGGYYQSGDLFYQRLWHQRLSHIGFRVISVQKQPYHGLWEIRGYDTLTAQTYLLRTLPASELFLCGKEIMLKQLCSEIQRIAKDLGAKIRRDCIHVGRKGAYIRITFIWPLGKPGRWVQPEKKSEAFSFLIRPCLRRNRN